MRQLFFALILATTFLLAGGCGYKTEDRCWIDDYGYKQVKKLYEKTQTLDLVRRSLEDQHNWRQCEINEALYRLRKEYHLEE